MASSTVPQPVPLPRLLRARWGRRLFFTVLCAFLLAGLLGVYGVRTTDVATTGGGFEMTVHYASVSRGGLATPWSVEVRRRGGFGGEPLTLATTAAYFDIFDENGLDPDPMKAVNDGERIVWTFATPARGDTVEVSFDARVEPAVQLERARATTSVLVDDAPVASVDYSTFVIP
ncbi:MAG TPA: hypothetical protein VM264_00085 [Acidimicrobiales bacterium]|nr:hypothetical protein [Acidimicrobiales bacterium]